MSDDIWTIAAPGPSAAPTVWRVDLALDDARLAACRALLCAGEARRADRFSRAEDRRRFIVSHAGLRAILAGALGADPTELTFDADAAGKPALAGRWRQQMSFNLSHSGGTALIALAPAGRVGVDVEAVRPVPDWPRIVRSHFSAAETSALARLSGEEGRRAFFACWTRKEAFVKAVGLGLAMPLDRFTVSLPPEPPALVAAGDGAETARGWSLIHLQPAPDHVGAAAIDRAQASWALRSLRSDWTDAIGRAGQGLAKPERSP